MTGYHYTSWENWETIRERGLVPQLITKPEIVQEIGAGVKATWTWTRRQKGLAHQGQILFTMMKWRTTKIVLISYDYEQVETVQLEGCPIRVRHDGSLIGQRQDGTPSPGWVYHDREPGTLVTASISPDRLRLVNTYDFAHMVAKCDQVTVLR
jgi:hypothetical protein